MTSLFQDIRVAMRSFSRSPGFAAIVAVTLAVGIGGTVAMFSVADGVLFTDLPYRDSDRMAVIWNRHAATGFDGDLGQLIGGSGAAEQTANRAVTHKLHGHRERSARQIAAHQAEAVPIRETEKSFRKPAEPGGVVARQGQRESAPAGFCAHGCQITQVHSQ